MPVRYSFVTFCGLTRVFVSRKRFPFRQVVGPGRELRVIGKKALQERKLGPAEARNVGHRLRPAR